MDLERFEQLWPQRHKLNAEIVRELEEFKGSNKECKAYVQGGSEIRSLVKLLGTEEAPDNFAYNMRIYAENHRKESITEKPAFRWMGLGAGIATGALAVMLSITTFNNPDDPVLAPDGTVPVISAGMDMHATDTQHQKKSSAIESEEVYAEQTADSLEDADSTKGMKLDNSHNWDVRSVSSER